MRIDRRHAFAGALLLLAGCTKWDDEPSDDEAAVAAAVRVEAMGCGTRASLGAGSFVADGLVLTVAHVVAGSESVEVLLPDSTRATATVVAIDRDKDLAVLAVDSAVTPLERDTMPVGADGTFVVYREEQPVVMPFETLSFVDIDAPTIDHDGTALRRGYQIEAEVTKGDSGAVLVHDGVATAVVFARSTATGERAYAIDITEADPLLAKAQADPTQVDVGPCV